MPKISRLIAAAIFLVAGAPISAQTPTSETLAVSSLNPGDQVRIAVWRQPEFSGDFTISGTGTINHPLYREIQVTGVPLSTVDERIRAFLTKYITNPQFVVQPLVRIVVAGEVRTPNVYSVPPETTIAQALALAAGPTDRGNLSKAKIVRDGQEIPVDLTRADSDVGRLQIRSGDQILIPRKSSGFKDYAGPLFSGIAAAAALVNIFLR